MGGGGGGGSSFADFLLRQLRLCSWLGFHLNGFNGRMEGHGKDNLGIRVRPKARLIVPDFTISTYGSSCKHLIFSLNLAPLLSLSIK